MDYWRILFFYVDVAILADFAQPAEHIFELLKYRIFLLDLIDSVVIVYLKYIILNAEISP